MKTLGARIAELEEEIRNLQVDRDQYQAKYRYLLPRVAELGAKKCSFCGKSETLVICMLESPINPRVRICNECVAVAPMQVQRRLKKCTCGLDDLRSKVTELSSFAYYALDHSSESAIVANAKRVLGE